MTDINIDYSNDQISAAEQTEQNRQAIKAVAGDNQSLQGSIADTAQISMLSMGKLLLQLKAGKTIDEIIASDTAFALCIEFAEANSAESTDKMKIPFQQKPQGSAIKDIIHRTHAVGELYNLADREINSVS